MRAENARMQRFLAHHGIKARAKWLSDGSLKRCWRLYDAAQKWTPELAERLNALGFVDNRGEPLAKYSGNGGVFCVFVRGHEEFLSAEPFLTGEPTRIESVIAPESPTNDDSDLAEAIPLIEAARALWRQRCAAFMASRGDSGSCVIGAGVAINYKAPRCRSGRKRIIIDAGDVTSAQGSLVWEESVNDVLAMLRPALGSVFYAAGRMD